jgi:hypothetical protein
MKKAAIVLAVLLVLSAAAYLIFWKKKKADEKAKGATTGPKVEARRVETATLESLCDARQLAFLKRVEKENPALYSFLKGRDPRAALNTLKNVIAKVKAGAKLPALKPDGTYDSGNAEVGPMEKSQKVAMGDAMKSSVSAPSTAGQRVDFAASGFDY